MLRIEADDHNAKQASEGCLSSAFTSMLAALHRADLVNSLCEQNRPLCVLETLLSERNTLWKGAGDASGLETRELQKTSSQRDFWVSQSSGVVCREDGCLQVWRSQDISLRGEWE